MPPDSGIGEEDEEEEESPAPKEGDKEAPTKEGQQIELTPEQANWLLEGFRLDRERRLPMGQSPGEPKDRNRPNW
ncbi:hypothetical protein EG829_32560 [bacterium]|nr:hypothetical protein [bacterium]